MKKIILLFISIVICTTGCFSSNEEDLIQTFNDYVTESTSYYLTGTMEISNGEETYSYSLESSYLADSYYKVVLINQTNDHEQIILRNEESVYVITPSLNKSFKFDSVWPDNSSQAYLLGSILNDILADDESTVTEIDSGYEIKSTVNYPNNGELLYQIITFDEDMIPKSVEVYDENDYIYISVQFLEIDMDADLSEEDFSLDNYVDQAEEETEEEAEEDVCDTECDEDTEDCENDCSIETSSLDSVLYPLYVPSNTSLTSAETVMTDYSERVILTFSGDNNFVVIEEVSTTSAEFEVIPITGNPLILTDTVAALSTNSMYFTKNGVDYYIVSNDLTSAQMVSIANSIGSVQSVISTK